VPINLSASTAAPPFLLQTDVVCRIRRPKGSQLHWPCPSTGVGYPIGFPPLRSGRKHCSSWWRSSKPWPSLAR